MHDGVSVGSYVWGRPANININIKWAVLPEIQFSAIEAPARAGDR
jgi:hypothetical protein